MKKLFALAFMSLAAVSWTPSTASAWWPCFPACCKSCCTTTICLRQYNAFTPVCSGTLSCDGCCPVNLTSGNLASGPAIFQHPYAAGFGYAPYGYAPYGSAAFAGQGYPMGQLPPAAVLSQPMMQNPVMGGMPAAPMAPMPAPTGAVPFSAPAQGIGYKSMYSAVPYYWNGGR